MPTFIIDSTPTSQIYSFYKNLKHVIGNCLNGLSQVPIFVTELIFGTTQPATLVTSQIPITHVPIVLECTSSFIVTPSHSITQMLNDIYLIANPTGNSILPIYLGNYGPSYASNNNISQPMDNDF